MEREETTMKITVRQLAESALMIAAATLLSLIKIDLPFGGGVTVVSMLPIILISHRYGWKWGVLTAFVYSVAQLLLGLDNVAYAENFVMGAGIILLDYIVAYTVIGLSGMFGKSRGAVAIGIAVTFTLRLMCHLITGAWIWGVWMPDEFMGLKMTNPWFYSFLYNGWYMLFELVITEAVAMLIYSPLKTFLSNKVTEE
jgi:thiamine transporter